MKLGGILALAASLVLTGCAAEQPEVSQKVKDYYSNGPHTSAAPEPTLVTVVGDSYVAGSNMGGTGSAGWTTLASADLQTHGVVDITRAGVGGSGYVERGPTNTVFGEAMARSVGPKTDLIVFFGSINDRNKAPDAVKAAAAQTFAEAKKLAPNAKLLVFGPAWMNSKVPAEVLATKEAVHAAADAAGAQWVDPIAERWFFDQPALIGTDKVHPTNEGHAYMEKLILPHLVADLP